MKIKRFFENEVQGPEGSTNLVNVISPDKLNEIITELQSYTSEFQDKLNSMKKIEKELSKFKSKSKTKMDQIDDSYVQIQSINSVLNKEIIDKMDTIISNLKDRIDNGKNYIYGS